MADVVTAVTNDAVVGAAAARLGRSPLDLLAAAGDPDERGRLLLFVDVAPHTLFSAAIVRRVLMAVAPGTPSGESVAGTYSADELRGWEREPAHVETTDASRDESWSDGRWAWAATVVLLLVETMVRRRRRAAPETESHARVA
jgi:hypothetical protein